MAKQTESPQVIRIAVKVAAGASHSAISGWRDHCLRVRLSTAPERGKANAALIALLAQALGLSKSAVSIVRGQHSPRKTIEISGLSEPDIIRLLGD
ncbi:MAG: DUF167 domain-containing protein [Gammaproteobacteria bacterium]|jgi:hypothetical protein|nr:DUF167 domain-containing protein [Gammaproteobacteria bacterium]